MDRNVGGFDRVWRVVVGLALLVFGYRNRNRTVGTLAFVAGSDIFATAIIQRCPMNALFGIDTCGTDQ
ncbi:YgaP family membrane protein [Natronorubrum sp. DTA28]|uniref:YgaP family membrane protein n=1 Tax=Natronorubrum sp. DTA28 TaxID=3447019 RepID=UPI003F87138D